MRVRISASLGVEAALFAVFIAFYVPGMAAAQSAPPAAAAKPADPAFAAAERAFLAADLEARKQIQRDLMWVAKFEGAISGDFGPLTFAAIRRFKSEAKLAGDAILQPAERERLARDADGQRAAVKFAGVTDKVSGMKIGLPGTIFVKTAPNASGGTRFQDQDEKITLDLSIFKPEDTLATLYEKGTDPKVAGRKITYKLLKPDFFVISGETAGGKFYRRLQAEGEGPIRGFSIGYDKAVAPAIERFVVPIAASFEPFPKAGGAKPAKAGPVGVAEAPRQRRATGIVIAPERVVTSEAALRGCADIVLGGTPGGPARAPRLIDGTGLMVLSAKTGPALAARLGAPKDGAATLIQRDSEGDLAASAAVIDGGKVTTSLQDGGAGAALFDRSGAFIGVINAQVVTKFRVAGIVPTLSYAFLPAAEVLKAAGIAKEPDAAAGPALSSAEVAELARGAVIALRCASDK